MPDGATKIVEVPGIGNVEFPFSMADQDISSVIQKSLLKNESYQASNPPQPKPMQMEGDSPIVARAEDIATHQRMPSVAEMRAGNVGAGKFGAETLIGQGIAGPVAKVLDNNVVPALKAVPWIGKAVGAIDEAPSVIGKVARGATVGAASGGVEGLVRGKGLTGAAKDAGTGALAGGALGLALPTINRLAGTKPGVYPGASLPDYEDYALNRGKEINSMMRQQPDAFAPPEPEPPPTYPGGSLPTYEDYAANRGKEILAARKLQPNAFAPPAPPEPELGSPENPGFMSKLPARLSPNLRGDPFAPTPAAYQSPLGDIPSEEGVPGSVPKPSGRIVKLEQEFAGEDQMQKIATQRAKAHGMLYAAGMRPAGGGRVPMTPTGITTTEYPGPRAEVDPGSAYAPPSSLQGNPSPFAPTTEEELAEMARRRQLGKTGANVSGLL